VTRRNGAAAGHTLVILRGPLEGDARWEVRERTDEDGRVSFEEIPPGRIEVEVRETGFIWIRQEVDLGPAEFLCLQLREPRGRTVRLHVVDPCGSPVACARIAVDPMGGPAYALLEGGVQVLGLRTDRSGECVLPGLPAEPVRITATLGSRSVTWTAGEDDEGAEVVLPDARGN
jgi:hypothetical protein